MYRRVSFVFTIFIVSLSVQANDLEIALSDETAQFTFTADTGSVGNGGGRLSLGGFFNEEDDIAATLGFMVTGLPAGRTPFAFGLGAKAYATHIDDIDDEFYALALGARMRYTFPSNTPMHIAGDVHYAPDITTSNDADGLLDVVLRFEIEFIPGTSGFVGYRLFELQSDVGSDYEFDDNLHLGVRLNF